MEFAAGDGEVQVVRDGTEVHADVGGGGEDHVEVGVGGDDHVDVGGGDAADQATVRNLWKLACSSVEVSGGETMSPLLKPRINAAAHSSESRWVAPTDARLG